MPAEEMEDLVQEKPIPEENHTNQSFHTSTEQGQPDEDEHNSSSPSKSDIGVMSLKRSDGISPKVADVLDKVMTEELANANIGSKQSEAPTNDQTTPPSQHLNPVTQSVQPTSTQSFPSNIPNSHYLSPLTSTPANFQGHPYLSSPLPSKQLLDSNPQRALFTSPLSASLASSTPLSPYTPLSLSSTAQSAPEVPGNKEHLYFCHLCNYTGSCKDSFDEHLACHFEYICPHCDYKSRTEGRLKRHIKDFHTVENPESFSPAKNGDQRMPGRPKIYRCKQCEYVGTTKDDFWAHSRTHIKDEKLLQCPRCPFVTEYKHHLEYHLRNHFGSKPFKCNKCNYSCVNKSMLNSHMKSHTNVYQYRCADCTYATKYCHSLKLHLRKYNHKPATVLNNDGSLPQGIDAEASGLMLLSKRGPPRGQRGPKKDKLDAYMSQLCGMSPGSFPMGPAGFNGGMMSPYWPFISQLPNGFHPAAHHPPLLPSNMSSMNHNFMPLPYDIKNHSEIKSLRCSLCSFTAESMDQLSKHVFKVHASENQDIFNMFGLSSESQEEEKSKLQKSENEEYMKYNSLQNSFHNDGDDEEEDDESIGDDKELHIQTETDSENKNTPHSWPNSAQSDSKYPKTSSSHSLPNLTVSHRNGAITPSSPVTAERVDILKQMTLKFGSDSLFEMRPNGECPLDLTKRKAECFEHENGNVQYADSEVSSSPENSLPDVNTQPPKKRSRKGKAYKLDSLCLKLKERRMGSPCGSDTEESSGENHFPGRNYMETAVSSEDKEDLVDDTKTDISKPFENESFDTSSNINDSVIVKPDCIETDDFDQIHDHLKILNDEVKPQNTDLFNSHSGIPVKEENGLASLKADEDNSNCQMMDLNHHRRPKMSSALIKGTEIAMKILQNTDNNTSRPNGHIKESIQTTDQPTDLNCIKDKQKEKVNGSLYECSFCDIAFGDCVMYTMHMGYHGYKEPFKCNMCGSMSRDKVEFFLHIARTAHS